VPHRFIKAPYVRTISLPLPKNGSHTVPMTPYWNNARYVAIAKPAIATATMGNR
jgi:hypothetical protein